MFFYGKRCMYIYTEFISDLHTRGLVASTPSILYHQWSAQHVEAGKKGTTLCRLLIVRRVDM